MVLRECSESAYAIPRNFAVMRNEVIVCELGDEMAPDVSFENV